MLFLRLGSDDTCIHYIVFWAFYVPEIVYNLNSAILVLEVQLEYEHLKIIYFECWCLKKKMGQLEKAKEIARNSDMVLWIFSRA